MIICRIQTSENTRTKNVRTQAHMKSLRLVKVQFNILTSIFPPKISHLSSSKYSLRKLLAFISSKNKFVTTQLIQFKARHTTDRTQKFDFIGAY